MQPIASSTPLVSKRDYVILLLGDTFVFTISLWLALLARAFHVPSSELFLLHLQAFSGLFVAWLFVFFLADLYGKHTRIFRIRLPMTIFAAQTINVVLAALFFFAVPGLGIAPKTVLLIYLAISSLLIVLWRVAIFGKLRTGAKELGILLVASGDDATALAHEVEADDRLRFSFAHSVDYRHTSAHEAIRQVREFIDKEDITFLVADFADPALDVALPMHLLVADAPEEFALAVLKLLRDPPLRSRLAANARRLVEQRYTWEQSAQALERVWLAAASARGCVSR